MYAMEIAYLHKSLHLTISKMSEERQGEVKSFMIFHEGFQQCARNVPAIDNNNLSYYLQQF